MPCDGKGLTPCKKSCLFYSMCHCCGSIAASYRGLRESAEEHMRDLAELQSCRLRMGELYIAMKR